MPAFPADPRNPVDHSVTPWPDTASNQSWLWQIRGNSGKWRPLAATVSQAEIQAALTDKPGFRGSIEAASLAAVSQTGIQTALTDKPGFRTNIGAASLADVSQTGIQTALADKPGFRTNIGAASLADVSQAVIQTALTDKPAFRSNIAVRRVFSNSFTPDSTGWWRIVTDPEVIGGVLRIVASDPTVTTDIEVSVHVDKDTRGVMNQTRHSVRGLGHVRKMRVARAQDGRVVLDIHVDVANTLLKLEAEGELFPGFVTAPIKPVQIIADTEANQVDDLDLGTGLRSTGGVLYHLGSNRDPGRPFAVNGRAAYVHGLNLGGGSPRFTGGTDHFHLTMTGGPNSGSGSRTGRAASAWNTFQQQNSNSASTNDIFLGGITDFFYGETPLGANTRYGISTHLVQTTGAGSTEAVGLPPSAPDWYGTVDLWYTANTDAGITLPGVGQTLMVAFQPGVAGISAAILPAVVLEAAVSVAVPVLGGNQWRLRVRLYGLDGVEWNKDQATPASGVPTLNTTWETTLTPAAIHIGDTSRTLAAHPTRRDKVIATFSQPHGLLLGQVVVVRFPTAVWGVPANSYSGCVTEVTSATVVEVKIGIARRTESVEVGAREYTTRDVSEANMISVPSSPFVTGDQVRLSVVGTMQDGLAENLTYWVEKSSTHRIRLHSNSTISHPSTTVVFNRDTGRGIYTIRYANTPAQLASDKWTLHIGSRDPVHQQTIADVGWTMHRNVFANRRGVAAGTVVHATLGGLCDIPRWTGPAVAAGFDCSAAADFSYAFGGGIRNVTPRSAELGATDALKLRVTETELQLVKDGVPASVIVSAPPVNGGTPIYNSYALTKQQYTALGTPAANTHYHITDALVQHDGYATLTLNGVTVNIPTITPA